ncbi:hypothetical protein ACNKHM_27660 [Shigella sonnei]
MFLMMRILKQWSGVRTFGDHNAGQDCTAACRIYAQKGITDTPVEKLVLRWQR